MAKNGGIPTRKDIEQVVQLLYGKQIKEPKKIVFKDRIEYQLNGKRYHTKQEYENYLVKIKLELL